MNKAPMNGTNNNNDNTGNDANIESKSNNNQLIEQAQQPL